MKKLLLLLVFMGVYANAQIVNIPDANFKAKLLSASASNQIASIETPDTFFFVTTYNTIDNNGDGEIEVSEAQAIRYLKLNSSNISNLTGIEAFTNLQYLDCAQGQLTTLDVSSLNSLRYLACDYNQLSTINVSGLTNLEHFSCSNNQLSTLNVSTLVNLKNFSCNFSQLTNLNLAGLMNLKYFFCTGNLITSLNILGLTNLIRVTCNSNQLTSLNLSGLTNLDELNCMDNNLTSLNVSDIRSLTNFNCSYNQLTSIDVSSLINLHTFTCTNNQITLLFMKNGFSNILSYSFELNPLYYICCSDNQLSVVQSRLVDYGYTNTCHANTYCSFTPGVVFYNIRGHQKFDVNNNGCDVNDGLYPNLRMNINNGSISTSVISNTSGDYNIPVQAGVCTLTPKLENPNYFNVSPATATVTFPTQSSPFTQDFCVTPNGTHKDVEIVIVPIGVARPGFPAQYKLVYKNKGNITVDGTIAVNFSANPDVMHFQSATPNISSQSATELYWDYTALHPFEIREINFSMLLNTPTDTPPLNAGNYLGIDADITPVIDDENYIDNHSEIKQLVVNSFDPNDKTCLEGETISNSMIGQYVHYMIRFENTGTYPAQNIVVKDMIDTAKFDVSTLQMTKASHDCYTRINGNKVEFIFENINLPFDDANNDGYVVFKIKTKSTLAQNSSVSNTADIFFDYNFPITTNTATTNFANLATQNVAKAQVSVYPNPAKNVVNIKSENEINSISIFDIQGRQVQTKIVGATETVLDISNLQQGNYLLKINTDKGIATEKIVKE